MEDKDDNLLKNYLSEFEKAKDAKPKRNGVFLAEEKEKFYVALSEEKIYELSALAYYVWLLCDGEHSIGQIAEKISQDIQVDIDKVIEPLMLSLQSLNSAGLITY